MPTAIISTHASRRFGWLALGLSTCAVALLVAPWRGLGHATRAPAPSVDPRPQPLGERALEHGSAVRDAPSARATTLRNAPQPSAVQHPALSPRDQAPDVLAPQATSYSQLDQQTHALNLAIQHAARGANPAGLTTAGELSVPMPSRHDARAAAQLTAASPQLTPRQPALEIEERAPSPPQVQHEQAQILNHMLSATQQPFAAEGGQFIQRTHNPTSGVRVACVPAQCQASVSGAF